MCDPCPCKTCDASGCYGKCPTSTRCSACRFVRCCPCPPPRCPINDDVKEYRREQHYLGAWYATLCSSEPIKNNKNQRMKSGSEGYNDGKLSDLPWVVAKRSKEKYPVYVVNKYRYNILRHLNDFKSQEMIDFDEKEREELERQARKECRRKLREEEKQRRLNSGRYSKSPETETSNVNENQNENENEAEAEAE